MKLNKETGIINVINGHVILWEQLRLRLVSSLYGTETSCSAYREHASSASYLCDIVSEKAGCKCKRLKDNDISGPFCQRQDRS